MRMWMADPKNMCRKHLLGEHVELHMIATNINKKRKLSGYLIKNLIFPEFVRRRHEDLVIEMKKRNYKHKSELPGLCVEQEECYVFSNVKLFERCSKCKEKANG